jgi:hypothetical protein
MTLPEFVVPAGTVETYVEAPEESHVVVVTVPYVVAALDLDTTDVADPEAVALLELDPERAVAEPLDADEVMTAPALPLAAVVDEGEPAAAFPATAAEPADLDDADEELPVAEAVPVAVEVEPAAEDEVVEATTTLDVEEAIELVVEVLETYEVIVLGRFGFGPPFIS